MLEGAAEFLRDWGNAAHAAGWSAGELFSLDRTAPALRLDRRGAAWLLVRARVIQVLADRIRMEARQGAAALTFYRWPNDQPPAWEWLS